MQWVPVATLLLLLLLVLSAFFLFHIVILAQVFKFRWSFIIVLLEIRFECAWTVEVWVIRRALEVFDLAGNERLLHPQFIVFCLLEARCGCYDRRMNGGVLQLVYPRHVEPHWPKSLFIIHYSLLFSHLLDLDTHTALVVVLHDPVVLDLLNQPVKVRMLQGLLGTYPLLRVLLQHLLQQVPADARDTLE